MLAPDVTTTPDVSDEWPYGYGFCCCGCGQRTTVAGRGHSAKGWTKGVPLRFALGHNNRGRGLPVAARFWPKVKVGGPDECWPWLLTLDDEGYGQFNRGNDRCVGSHCVSWELTVGPVPPGMTLDHLCRNRACQNPRHLEPVSRGENVLRGVGPSANNARKAHCKYGHPFDEANTKIRPGRGRECRACIERRNRARAMHATASS